MGSSSVEHSFAFVSLRSSTPPPSPLFHSSSSQASSSTAQVSFNPIANIKKKEEVQTAITKEAGQPLEEEEEFLPAIPLSRDQEERDLIKEILPSPEGEVARAPQLGG